jgi:3-hydroxy-D-aspartate aldolase
MNNPRVVGLGPNERFIGVKGSRSQLCTPALLLDLDALERNIATMARLTKAASVSLRPHCKGGKSIEIARRQIAAGAVGICCATLSEAEVMANAGLENILVTSEATTPAMIDRVTALNAQSNGLIVNVENPLNVDWLATATEKAGKPLSLLVEFDVGQDRTGVTNVEAAITLARKVRASPYLVYRGIHAYYGHMQHIPAAVDRKRAAEGEMARIRDLVAALKAEGLAPEIVTGGGTGTFDTDIAGGVFTEIQPGSYPFMDREYYEIERTGERPFDASLFVLATVIASRNGHAIVNAGYKALATEGGPPVLLSPKLADVKFMFEGDEHGDLKFDPSGGVLKLGDAVEFLTPHCDPTINLYNQYHCVRGDTLVEIWPVDARGY